MSGDIKNNEQICGVIKNKLLDMMPEQGMRETDGMGGMAFYRHETANKIERCFYEPVMVVILQGRKHSVVGLEKISYGAGQCLVTGVDLPISSFLTDVSHEKPLLSITLPVDKYIISQLLPEVGFEEDQDITPAKAMAVTDLDGHIMDAFLRLTELADTPDQAKILAPMIIREIHYRMLAGPLGNQLRMISTYGTPSHQIAQAVDWLKENYDKPLKIDELAESVNMAYSTFRRHFKKLTTMSPVQYQKKLRLYEARRLMLHGECNASGACYAVGYESPTQFNREYKRMFGEPPRTSIRNLRAV